MADAKILRYHGMPAIVIDGKPMPPMMATIRTNAHNDIKVDPEYYRNLGKSGIKIYFLICDTEWLKPGAFDLFRREADILFREVPDAYVMLRVGMHPPVDWCHAHPEETLSYSDGVKKPMQLYTESYVAEYPAMYSLASARWRQDASEALLALLRRISELPYADRIVGCFFAAGGTSEWYYVTPTEYTEKTNRLDSGGFDHIKDDDFRDVYADLSPAFQRSFSSYLREIYPDDEALRRAWHDPTVTLDAPGIPDCRARYYANGVDYDIDHPPKLVSNSPEPPAPENGTNIGHFLDLAHHRRVFDFYRAWHLGVADSVIHFGKTVKEHYPHFLTGAFYGSAGSNKVFSMGQIGGVTRILDSDAIDFLASPGVYENRQPGGFTGQRQVFDSFALRNRIFIVEEDARTHFENKYFAKYVQLFDMEDTLSVLKREFGRNLCQNLQAWWFDQILGGKRYKDEEIYRLFEKQQAIARRAYESDRRKNSEIAFIYDEASYHVVSEETTHQMVELFRNYEIDRIGAPADRYYQVDLANPDMPDYKLYVFVNCFCVTEDQRESIHRKLAKNHATALFLYGQGFIDPESENPLSSGNITALTGFDITVADGVCSGMMKLLPSESNPLAGNLEPGAIWGDFVRKMWANCSSYMNRIKTSRVNLYPAFCASEGDGVVLARFLDTKLPSISVKEHRGFRSVYYGSKHLNSELARELARMAGCHIYCDTDDVLYANRKFVCLHATSGGSKTIHFPQAVTVRDAYTEKLLAKDTIRLQVDLVRGETLTLEII